MHIYITDSNGKTLCALSNDSSSLDSFIFYNSEFKQSLITPSTFTFSCLMNHPNSKHIACNNQVIFKYDDKYHMFTIIEIEETHNDTHDVTCYCESISLELINSVVIPSKNESQTAEQALRIVLSDVDWKVGEVGDLGSKDIDLNGYKTTLEEIQSLAELYEAEVRYRIEYDGNNGVKGKYIDFVERVSDVEGIRFEYGVNTTDVTRKVDASNVCTAVIPVGNDDIDIGDIECAVDQYRPFVKPKGQIWVGLDEVERTSITSSPYHIFASIKCETDDKFELAERAWKHLQENKIPKVEYTFNPAVINQKYEIGAKAYCIDKMMNLSLEAEISEIKICFEDPSQNSITLTNHVVKESNIDWSLINTIQSQLKEFEVEPEIIVSDTVPPVTEGKPIVWVDTSTATEDNLVVLKPFDGEQWQEVLTKEVVNQQIVNNNEIITEEITNNVTNYVDTTTEKTIIKGNIAPTNPKLNQLWIDTSKNPNQWKMWNGSEWQVILTEATDVDAQAKINTLQQTVNENVQEITQAKTDIQNTANELNTTKTDLLGEVNTLKANDTSINKQITDLETEVGTKLTQIEVETIVNNAVESLSGDGRNLILYGDCSVDIPRLEEENTYVNSGNVTLTIENGYLKFSTYSEATNCIYVLGENRINTLNAFKLDTYVLSFDFKLPDESDLTDALFGVVWDEYNGTTWHTLQKTINKLALIENKTDGWKRYALPFTFSQDDAILRHVYFVVKNASGLNTPIAFLDNIKVERGTEATAFSKNPNEMSLAEVNALKVRVTKNETDIQATNDKFASYVTQATYTADKTTMTESIESNASAIEQNAGQIALRVTNEQMTNAINDIQIGGRNILWNTNFDGELMQQKGVGWWRKYDNVEILNKNFMDKNVIHYTNATDDTLMDTLLQHIYSTNGITNRLENGEQYTLSFYIKGNGSVTTYIYPQIGDTSQNTIVDGTVNGKALHDNKCTWTITDTWTRHTYTFTVNDTLGASRSFTGMLFRLRPQSEIYIAMPQLEKGNKVTDWSPAPEDTQVNIDAVNTKVETNSAELNVLSNEISSKVSNSVYETDQANLTTTLNSHQSQITQNANAITTKLDSNTYTTDKATMNAKLESHSASIQANANAITTKVSSTELTSAIDNIKIGGRNLLLDSGTPRTNSNYPIHRYDLADTIEADETVTLQIKGTLGEGKIRWGIFNSGGNLGLTYLTPQEHLDDDGIYRHTFKWKTSYTANGQTITVSNTQLCVYPIEKSVTAQSHIEWIKLERGNKYTDYSPAPEDIQANINAVDTKVESNSAELVILSNEISSKVSNTTYNADKNDMTNRISIAESTIQQHANLISSKVSQTTYDNDKANTETRISEAESLIQQNANAITSKVSTTTYNSGISNLQGQIDANENDVSNLTNRVSTAESTLEQHSDLISTKVTRAEVEDYVNGAIESLSGDGRNMVVYGNCNTDVPRLEENNYYQISSNLEASIIDNMLRFKPKAAGYCEYLLGDLTTLNGFENDTYTLAFNYNIPTGSSLTPENFAVLVHDGAKEYGTFLNDMNVVSTTTSWTRVSFTFTFVESWKRSIRLMLNGLDANSYIYLDDIKVEKGATPSAFTKNPNEMTAAELAALKQRITTAESTLEQHADKIESKVEQTTYETDMNGITTNLGTVTSTLTQHADMIETKVSKDGVISSINQSAESVTINANKINLQGAVTADSISSLNGLNVGNGQFVVDGSGKVTVGGTLNGASGTFTGKFTQDGISADVTIENGTIQSYGTSTKISTLINEYGVKVYDDTWETQVNNQGISCQHFSGATSDFESSLSLLTNGYMQLSGFGLDVTGNIHTSSITVNNNLLNLTNDGISVNGERVVPLNRINAQPLWSGALFMNASQSITPSKPLSSCANGWILVWSLYENSTTHDAFFNFMYVPKTGFLLNGESYAVSSYMTGNTYPVHKSLYTNGVLLTGTPNCSATQTNTYNFYDNTKLVLRYVLEY